MRKNDTVQTIKDTEGYRRATAEEREAWYAERRAEAPHDSGGEPWVFSGTMAVKVPAGTRCTVVKARTTAMLWFRRTGGLTEVALPSGEHLLISRDLLAPVEV
jgi:hypothetical protein